MYGDSGGVSPSWPRPITGRAKVGRLMAVLGDFARWFYEDEATGDIRWRGARRTTKP